MKDVISIVLATITVFLIIRGFSVVCELALIFIAIHLANFLLQLIKDPFQEKLLPRINEKAVLITGCDTGFGHHLARKLDGIGVTVYAGCLLPDGPGAEKLKTISSQNLHVIPLDVTNDEQVNDAVKYVNEALGDKKLWAIVNNAGIATYGDVELCSLTNVQHLFDVNVFGTYRITKAFLPLIRSAKGRIVIVASIAGRITVPKLSPYSMTKHALVALVDGLRREMIKFGVTVHSIEPWMYRTNINSPELLQETFQDNWNQTSQDVKSEYGEEFLKAHLNLLADVDQHSRPATKIHEVVDALVNATVGENSKMRYELGTIWFLRILSFLPSQWFDYVTFIGNPDKDFKTLSSTN